MEEDLVEALRSVSISVNYIFGVCTMHWNVLAFKKKLFRISHQISVHLLKNSTLNNSHLVDI